MVGAFPETEKRRVYMFDALTKHERWQKFCFAREFQLIFRTHFSTCSSCTSGAAESGIGFTAFLSMRYRIPHEVLKGWWWVLVP